MAWRRLVRRFRQKRIELVEALCDETAAPPSVMAYRIAAIEGAPVAVVADVRIHNGGAYWVNSPNNWVWAEGRSSLRSPERSRRRAGRGDAGRDAFLGAADPSREPGDRALGAGRRGL